jgi:hypothetical protein
MNPFELKERRRVRLGIWKGRHDFTAFVWAVIARYLQSKFRRKLARAQADAAIVKKMLVLYIIIDPNKWVSTCKIPFKAIERTVGVIQELDNLKFRARRKKSAALAWNPNKTKMLEHISS